MSQPNTNQLHRLMINDEAMNKAFSRLKDSIIGGEEEEIYASIGETLLWVMSTHDWHLKFNLNRYKTRYQEDKDGVTLLGLRHAFNLMKHNVDFITLHSHVTEPLFSFPLEFDKEFEFGAIRCCWIKAEESLNGSTKNQKQNYIKYLEGKDVFHTIDAAIKFLLNERFPIPNN